MTVSAPSPVMNPNCATSCASLRLLLPDGFPDALVAALVAAGAAEVRARSGTHTVVVFSTVGGDIDACDDGAHLRAAGAVADVFVMWCSLTGHGGPVVPAEVSAQLAAAGATLSFDFYSL